MLSWASSALYCVACTVVPATRVDYFYRSMQYCSPAAHYVILELHAGLYFVIWTLHCSTLPHAVFATLMFFGACLYCAVSTTVPTVWSALCALMLFLVHDSGASICFHAFFSRSDVTGTCAFCARLFSP
ncbi:unnamed protein product, partial [Sphacelaria rigidula]